MDIRNRFLVDQDSSIFCFFKVSHKVLAAVAVLHTAPTSTHLDESPRFNINDHRRRFEHGGFDVWLCVGGVGACVPCHLDERQEPQGIENVRIEGKSRVSKKTSVSRIEINGLWKTCRT